MSDHLDMARFRTLSEAYGGAVARWPEEYRAAAHYLAKSMEGAVILEQASALDQRLDSWRAPTSSAELAASIAAGAPTSAIDMRNRLRWWWSGIGVAATLAGAAAGAAAVTIVVPIDVSAGSTSFGDVAGSDS